MQSSIWLEEAHGVVGKLQSVAARKVLSRQTRSSSCVAACPSDGRVKCYEFE